MSNGTIPRGGAVRNDENPKYNIGGKYDDPVGNTYVYVKVTGTSGGLVNGDLVAWASAASSPAALGEVVTRIDGGEVQGTLGTCTQVAGVAVGTVTTGYWTFIQIEGIHDAVKCDGGVSVGDPLVAEGGNTFTRYADTAVAGEEHCIFAVALENDDAADSTATVRARLHCYA